MAWSLPTKNPKWVAFFTIFLDLLGFGIIIPVNPFFVKSLGAAPWEVTMIGAAYSLMQFLFSPFWGKLSDRYGRKPIILSSVAMSGLGHFIFSQSSAIWMVLAARLLAGFGNANIGTAQAIIADTTTPENRSKGMALIGVAFGLGFVFGPIIGGILVHYGPQAPSLFAACLAGVNLLLAFLFLPETKTAAAPPTEKSLFSLKKFLGMTYSQILIGLFATVFFYTFGFSMMEQVLGFLLEKSYVHTENIIDSAHYTTVFLVVVGFTAIAVQGFLIGAVSRRWSEFQIIPFGLAIAGLSLFALPFASSNFSFYYVLILAATMAIGTGLFNPTASSLVSKEAPENKKGEILGTYQSLGSLGRVLGPMCAGALYQTKNYLPFVSGGFLFVLAAAIFIKKTRARPSGVATS